MIADSSSLNTQTSTQKDGTRMPLSAVGSLIKLLPTGTVFLFQFLNPVVTNSGQCMTSNKYLASILLLVCGLSCAFSSFTDSYTGTDNQRHYGIVTTKGLWSFSPESKPIDLSGYRLKFGDFVHSALALVVFAVLGLLDTNTVHCFYPDFESTQKRLLQVFPPAIGVFAGGVFVMFPNSRHGIGYPMSTDSNQTSPKSNDNASAQNPNDSALV